MGCWGYCGEAGASLEMRVASRDFDYRERKLLAVISPWKLFSFIELIVLSSLNGLGMVSS